MDQRLNASSSPGKFQFFDSVNKSIHSRPRAAPCACARPISSAIRSKPGDNKNKASESSLQAAGNSAAQSPRSAFQPSAATLNSLHAFAAIAAQFILIPWVKYFFSVYLQNRTQASLA